MNQAESPTFWERLAANANPSGGLSTLESPMTVVWIVLAWTLGAVANSIPVAALYFWFDEPLSGWISVVLILVYATGWFLFMATGSVRGTFALLMAASLISLAAVQLAMGGYANSGAQLMWGIGVTAVSTLLFRRREALAVAGLVIAAAIIFGFLEQTLQSGRAAPNPVLPSVTFAYTLITLTIVLIPVIALLFGRLSFERERAEGLLLNVLPAEVAAELKEHGQTTARHYDSISVLFADIVGFTPLSAEMDPDEMVNQLNDVFTYFDSLADKFGCEKIRTIGDNYMVASGLPTPRDDHAVALASMALEMNEYSRTGPLSFRLGINSGPAVAGVVGTKKFQYDVWGDTVNIASRMESHSEPGKIQVSEATHTLIKDHFETTPRGPIEVKGKGTLNTYWLMSPARVI